MSHRTTLTLDDYTLLAVAAGHRLAQDWRTDGAGLPDPSRSFNATLARLEAGRVFEAQDESLFDRMGEILCRALNDHHPRYGDRIFAGVAPDLFVVCPEDREREKLRELAEELVTFRGYRRAVLNRVAAERELRKLL